MMDWTDRHCRYLHRLFAPHALLYTEMIVSAALVRGARAARLLRHDPQEHPVALQLGGCDPKELAAAARIGAAAGFAEINLNVGCPSDRVKSGAFGACLMLDPPLVAECVRRMRDATQLPVTVKCRIGIDHRDDYEFFTAFRRRGAGRRGGCAHRARPRRHARRVDAEGKPRDSASQVRLRAPPEARAPGTARGAQRRHGRSRRDRRCACRRGSTA